MSVPARKNLVIYQGDDWQMNLRFRSRAADGTLGPYTNLTGQTAKAQVRLTVDDPVVKAEMTATIDNQIANTGGVTLKLTNTQTAVLAGEYYWDFQLTDSLGVITTFLAGTFVCDKQVTR